MAIVKRRPGRPAKFNTEQLQYIQDEFNKYIDETEDCTIVGFVAKLPLIDGQFVNRELIGDRPEFSPLRKRCMAKQEAFLLTQHKNPTMSIFRLKQPVFGYTDKREVEQRSLNLDIQADPKTAQDFMKYLQGQTKRID